MKNCVYILTDLFDDEIVNVYSTMAKARMAAVDLIRSVYSDHELNEKATELGIYSGEKMLDIVRSNSTLDQELQICVSAHELDAPVL